MTAGIVVVTYNSAEVIGACLDACLGAGSFEIVVVDNASQDGTLAEARRRGGVKVIANRENRGFAAAANQGATALEAGCVLLVNPDAVLQGGLEHLIEACSREGVGAAGGRLVDEAGRPQTGFAVRGLPTPLTLVFEVLGLNRLWPSNPVNRRYRCLELDPDRAAEVEQPAGAFLMVRRDAWLRLGGFDEGFGPVWFEDVDFAKRLQEAGLKVQYVPQAVARHRGGHSVRTAPWETRQVYWYASLLRYASKHFGPWQRRAVCGAVLVASVPRMVTGILGEGGLRSVVVCGKVIRLATARLVAGGRTSAAAG